MHTSIYRKLNQENRALIDGIAEDARVQQMSDYIQHGSITTYQHCRRVAVLSCRLSEVLHLRMKSPELVRGAFLHDYFLYDWHGHKGQRLHGFEHPTTALQNAKRDFDLTPLEENIIQSHMWPLTPLQVPRSREALLVSIADKICSLEETLMERSGKTGG